VIDAEFVIGWKIGSQARGQKPWLAISAFHPTLENQDGRHPVDRFGALFDGKFGCAKQAAGFSGGEALVPEMNGELEMLAQVLGEGLDFFGLCAFGSAHAQGKADDDFPHVILTDDAVQVSEVAALVLTLEGFEALGGDAERVGDGDADAAGTDVEAEDAARGRRFRGHEANYRVPQQQRIA